MKAVWYEANGAAHDVLKVGERPTPEPAAGEVRVRIATSGVNPSDVKRRSGWNNQKLGYPWSIPNMDGAGRIDAVGAGVDRARIGERVWLHSTAWKRQHGTAAEFAVMPAHCAYRLPDSVDYTVGAGLGVPAMTAHRAVFGCEPVRGKTVLVTGGAGAVGFYAIQLAKWGGARVIATVSSAQKAAAARRAGADSVIDYKTQNVAEAVRAITGDAGIDHIVDVDFGANLPTSLEVLTNGGSIASYASMSVPQPAIPFYAMMFKNMRVAWVHVYSMPRRAMDDAARDIETWLTGGQAVHPTYHRFPMARAADAHVAVEQAVVGKVVIEIGAVD